jgi:hypothetical protein
LLALAHPATCTDFSRRILGFTAYEPGALFFVKGKGSSRCYGSGLRDEPHISFVGLRLLIGVPSVGASRSSFPLVTFFLQASIFSPLLFKLTALLLAER